MCEQTSTEIKKYNVFTIANDKVNAGYSSTVKALASNYNHIQHISTLDTTSEFDKASLDEFVINIKNNLPANVLFAGGQNCCDRIRNIQKLLKEQLTQEEFNKISFTLNTERFNSGDNFNDIVNLTVITQENQETYKEINVDNKNITFHTVDISACGNKKAMEESAETFQKKNQELFSKLPLEQIDTFFYLGGNGQGFTSKERIDISKEYEDFIKTSFNMVDNSKPVVIFTHGFRTFRDLSKNDKPLNFTPIDKMYKTIEERLNINQECYVFSQKQDEKDNSKIGPVLIKFKKNKDNKVTKEEINVVNTGSLYNYSLLTAANKKNIRVVATQEQQNFPIEVITAGISISKIDSIKWKLQAQNHELMYKTVREQGDNLTTAKQIYDKILTKENGNTKLTDFTNSIEDFNSLTEQESTIVIE